MKRRVLNLLTVVSLPLCVATLVLWAASLRGPCSVRLTTEPGRARFVAGDRGIVYVAVQRVDDPGRGVPMLDVRSFGGINMVRPGDPASAITIVSFPPPRGRLGFRYERHSVANMMFHAGRGLDGRCDEVSCTIAGAPAWAPVALTAIAPAAWSLDFLRTRRARRRASRGLCPECGYDLTGNLSGVCPECGTAATAPVGAVGVAANGDRTRTE